MPEISKISTGIAGMDLALSGGIPEKNIVLISGGPGTGKTTLGMQFLINGARAGNKGLYISTEQTQENLIRQVSFFCNDISSLLDSNSIRFVFINILEEKESTTKLFQIIDEFHPSRIVIDSLTTFSEYISMNEYANEIIFRNSVSLNREQIQKIIPVQMNERTLIKRMLAKLMYNLRNTNATILITSELSGNSDYLSSDGVSEFLADGVILLKSMTVGDSLVRTLEIVKMRYTSILGGIKTYELMDSGFVIS